MKKLVRLLLTLVMILTLIANLSVQAVADTTTFYSKLSAFKNQKYAHNSIYKDNPNLTGGSQCFGYANELALYIWGSYPTNSMSAKTVNSGWKVTYGGSAVDNLCVGDIVRYRYHSIFITGISGDTIYYCHANSPSGTNKVTYDNTISRSTLKSRVSEKLTSPNTTKTGWVAHFIQNNNGGSGQVVDEKDTQKEEKPPIITEQSSLKINITKYPETISQGDSFELRGEITSNYNVTSVIGKIIDSNGENHGTTIESPGEKSNNIQNLHLGKSMDFGRLEAGNYTLNVEVMDSSGNKKTWSKYFKVKFEEPASTLSINLRNFPSSIENGEPVQLQGIISSNYIIVKVEAMLWGSEGIGYYPTTIYPNSKSVRIENTDLSDGIYFEGMPGGTYTLEITAKDEKTTKSITKRIKISKRIVEEDDDSWLYTIDTPEKFEDLGYNPIVSDEEYFDEDQVSDGEIMVKVNGKKVKFDQPPIIQDGRTLVPVRATCEAMGINVEWWDTQQKVVLTKGNTQVVLQIGNQNFTTNQNGECWLDVPPQIINGRTLLPIRAVAEQFGYNVEWNGSSRMVVIM